MTEDLVKVARHNARLNMPPHACIHLIEQMADRIEELEITLKKLEQWFDTDQEILDVMGNNEKADHMRKLTMIRKSLNME